MTDLQVHSWVEAAVKNKKFSSFTVEKVGNSKSCDGYIAVITFVKVRGKTAEDTTEVLELVIKSSKPSEALRKQQPMQELFQKEIFIYETVIPTFIAYQRRKTKLKVLDFLVTAVASKVESNMEWIIFENLLPQGYRVADRKQPMSFEQTRLVMEMFGKWHSFSLALKHEKPSVFKNLTQNQDNMWPYWIRKGKLEQTFFDWFNQACLNSLETHETTTKSKLKFTIDELKHILFDFYKKGDQHRVILHADCWTNNFMFKYERASKTPTDVRLLDWQLSGIGSPILDLSHFIYCCCPTGEYKDVGIFLQIYHKSLRKCLGVLGLSADKIFSYSELMQHWRSYSTYGIVLASFVLMFSLMEDDEAPDLAAAAEKGEEFARNFKPQIKNQEEYYRRMRHNFIHYVRNLK